MPMSMANPLAYRFPGPASARLCNLNGERSTLNYRHHKLSFSATSSYASDGGGPLQVSSPPWLLIHDPNEECCKQRLANRCFYFYFRNISGDTTIRKKNRIYYDFYLDHELPKLMLPRYLGCGNEWLTLTMPPDACRPKPSHVIFDVTLGGLMLTSTSLATPLDYVVDVSCNFPSTYGVEKLAMDSNPDASTFSDPCRAIGIIGPSRSLAITKPGAKYWTLLKTEPCSNSDYGDVIYSNEEEQFYAIRGGKYGAPHVHHPYWIEAWDVSDMEHGNLWTNPCDVSFTKRNLIRASGLSHESFPELQTRMESVVEKRYLVESRGDIFLVLRFLPTRPYSALEEKRTTVYMLNKMDKRWEFMESIGDDRAFFVGDANTSFSVDTNEIADRVKGDSIYFVDENFRDGHFVGVYNLKTGTEEEIFSNRKNPSAAPPVWLQTIPDILY